MLNWHITELVMSTKYLGMIIDWKWEGQYQLGERIRKLGRMYNAIKIYF